MNPINRILFLRYRPPARFSHHRSGSKKLDQVVSGDRQTCLEPCKVPRKGGLWSMLRRRKPPKECIDKKPPPRLCETVEFVTEEQAESDMSTIAKTEGGEVFRTCGVGYLVQKDHLKSPAPQPPSLEDQVLEDMLKDPSLKGQCDPMPPFTSAEMRLIELSERKLHPAYRKLMSIPKRPKAAAKGATGDAQAGPLSRDDFPPHLKIDREMLDRKNIMCDLKRAEPPEEQMSPVEPGVADTKKNVKAKKEAKN